MTESVVLEGICDIQIFYEDTDFTGFVYHANYLKYFDRARELVVGVERLRDFKGATGMHFVVAHADVKYLAPVRFGDIVRIRSRTEVTRSPLHIYKQDAYVGDKLVVAANIQLVCLGEDERPKRISRESLTYLAEAMRAKT